MIPALLAIGLGMFAHRSSLRSVEERWEREHPPSAAQWVELLQSRGWAHDGQSPAPTIQELPDAELWVFQHGGVWTEIRWGETRFLTRERPHAPSEVPVQTLGAGWRAYRALEMLLPARGTGGPTQHAPPTLPAKRDPLRLEY